MDNFAIKIPPTSVHNPATTLVKIIEEDKKIYYADGFKKKLFSCSAAAQVIDSITTGLGASFFRKTDRSMYVLSMGVLQPSDEKKGDLTIIDVASKKSSILLDSLQRPVYAAFGDLTGDGKEDIVVCEFGNNIGSLSWFERKEEGFVKHVLRPIAGAIRTEIFDFNHDGLPDIIALMAQGDEGVFIYFNEGGGKFTEKRVLRFPPSYGSNSLELFDFNNDGFMDFITTNGDNGDYPPLMKPYHGIRIFLNDGKNNFNQKVFLPMNGVGKAVIRDFNKDGNYDIAAISYFPDYDVSPEESFILWENKGNLIFVPHSFPQATDGRWITMDAADIDNDGDCDIVLGNANFQLGKIPDSLKKKLAKKPTSILILENKRY